MTRPHTSYRRPEVESAAAPAAPRGSVCVTFTPATLSTLAAIGVLLTSWLVVSTGWLLFHRDIQEAARFYEVENQRAYEDRIATLRRQIDEINSRQFLDQTKFERELADMRRRQAQMEEYHARIGGLFRTAGEHDLSIRSVPAKTEPVQTGAIVPLVKPTVASAGTVPILLSRPQPLGFGFPERNGPSDNPATRALAELGGALDRMANSQNMILNSLETSVVDKVRRLAAIPGAIGAAVPASAQIEEGIGGPFVELRGGEGPMEADNQIVRIENAIERLDILSKQVRYLPVRLPLAGSPRLSSGYGTRMDPFLRRPAMHTGLDFRARTGTPVLAAGAGRVTRAGRMGGYGNLVEIDHGNGYQTRYAHLNSIAVSRGQSVEPGDIVGEVGSTGRSTGPHLHYETRKSGAPRNPRPFVDAAKLVPEGY